MADTSNAQIGSQTKVYMWTGSPPSWTQLPNVRNFGDVGADSPEVDSTDLDSTARERIPGLPDGKEITFVGVMNSTMDPLLRGIYNAGINVDIWEEIPAPFNTDFYYTLTPLGWSFSNVNPDGLREESLRGRISGSIVNIDTHP